MVIFSYFMVIFRLFYGYGYSGYFMVIFRLFYGYI